MIYSIESYDVNGDFATELLVEFQENLTTGDRAMVYYHLRNLNDQTTAFSMFQDRYVGLPYKILSQEKMIITGSEFQDLMAGSIFALDIVLSRRPDIRLRRRSFLIFSDCFGKELGEVYLDNDDFAKASFLYTDPELSIIFEYEGTVSDNEYSGYYSPKSGLQEIKPCK